MPVSPIRAESTSGWAASRPTAALRSASFPWLSSCWRRPPLSPNPRWSKASVANPAELRRRVPGITQKVLTETLRGMEGDGLVERRVLKVTAPQHVEYSLTALGTTLREPLAAICDWAAEHA